MNNLILGNLISLIGAVFLSASCVAKSPRKVMLLQLAQCMILTVAQIVFGKGSGAVSMSLAGVRNLIIALGHYNALALALILTLTVILGFAFNTAGALGILPIAAGVFYSTALYLARSRFALKISIAILLFIWIIYSALILDLFGTISNTLAEILNLTTLVKWKKAEKDGRE